MITHWILWIWLFYGTNAFAEQHRLAVLEFRGMDVEQKILFLLSDEIRSGILKVVDKQSILVMTRESTLQILKDNGKDEFASKENVKSKSRVISEPVT